jgi:hypothetical protein
MFEELLDNNGLDFLGLFEKLRDKGLSPKIEKLNADEKNKPIDEKLIRRLANPKYRENYFHQINLNLQDYCRNRGRKCTK